MNGLINQHMIELLSIIIATVSYFVLHVAISYSARFISGRKTGVIRQCIQGFSAVACFIVAMLISCNGAVRYYHIISYIVMISVIIRVGKIVISAIEKYQMGKNASNISEK